MISEVKPDDNSSLESLSSQIPSELQKKIRVVSEIPVGAHPTGIDEIVKSLSDDTALLEYNMIQHLEDQQGFWALFAVLPRTKGIKLLHRFDLEETLAAKDQLYKIIEKVEKGLDSAQNKTQVRKVLERSRSPYEAILSKLGNLMLPESVIKELSVNGVRRLVIVPESYLFDIPWSILRVAIASDETPLIGKTGVNEGFEIVIAPSASAYVECRKKTTERSSKTKAGFSDIVLFGGNDTDSKSDFAEFINEKIKKDIFDEHYNTKHFFEKSASQKNFLKNISASRAFFFYGHAIYDSDTPLNSHLVLSDKKNGRVQDYPFSAREILNLNEDRDWSSCGLFIMASCQGQKTDYSDLWDSREIVGLNTAIFQRGISSIIGSLWKTRIASVCKFYPTFFHSYISGNSASKSLQEAQLSLQSRNDLFSHPHLWGGIYLMGDWNSCLTKSDY
jgi:CHAT domain-containing protein